MNGQFLCPFIFVQKIVKFNTEENMSVELKIKNVSKKAIPEELLDAITFKTLNDANDIAEQYNLKIIEMDRVIKDGKIVEQILTIGDINE